MHEAISHGCQRYAEVERPAASALLTWQMRKVLCPAAHARGHVKYSRMQWSRRAGTVQTVAGTQQ